MFSLSLSVLWYLLIWLRRNTGILLNKLRMLQMKVTDDYYSYAYDYVAPGWSYKYIMLSEIGLVNCELTYMAMYFLKSQKLIWKNPPFCISI